MDHDKVINIHIGGSDVYETSRNFLYKLASNKGCALRNRMRLTMNAKSLPPLARLAPLTPTQAMN
jgi:hypothetical protein